MKIEWKNCFRICFSVFLLYLCIENVGFVGHFLGTLFGVSFPIIIGFIIAYIVNIPMSFYERFYFPGSKRKIFIKTRRPVCMIAAFLTFALIVYLSVKLIVPELVLCVELLYDKVAGMFEYFTDQISGNAVLPKTVTSIVYEMDWTEIVEAVIDFFTGGVGSAVDIVIDVAFSVFSGLLNGFLSLIFAIYLLLAKEQMFSNVNRLTRRYLKEKVCAKAKYVCGIFNHTFHKYIVGQFVEAVILGVLCALGMWIMGMPYPVMIGALMAFTALIPVAGAYIGAIVGAFMIMTVSPVQSLVFLVYIIILQQIEGNVIYPKVVGSSVGLPAFWVMAAITVGGGMFGMAGMLVAVPVAASVYRIIGDDVRRGEKQLTPSNTKEEKNSDKLNDKSSKKLKSKKNQEVK